MASTRGDFESRIGDKMLTSRMWVKDMSQAYWFSVLALSLSSVTSSKSYNLGFLIRKMGIITVYTFRVVLRVR